eukprot:g19335.t1
MSSKALACFLGINLALPAFGQGPVARYEDELTSMMQWRVPTVNTTMAQDDEWEEERQLRHAHVAVLLAIPSVAGLRKQQHLPDLSRMILTLLTFFDSRGSRRQTSVLDELAEKRRQEEAALAAKREAARRRRREEDAKPNGAAARPRGAVEHVERRVDPDDNQSYTWEELRERYRGMFSEAEVLEYWQKDTDTRP